MSNDNINIRYGAGPCYIDAKQAGGTVGADKYPNIKAMGLDVYTVNSCGIVHADDLETKLAAALEEIAHAGGFSRDIECANRALQNYRAKFGKGE